jgi:hypothetical protein
VTTLFIIIAVLIPILFFIAGIGKGVSDAIAHGKLNVPKFSFFDDKSWIHKYKFKKTPRGAPYLDDKGNVVFVPKPKGNKLIEWYYNRYGIAYKEAFPLSGSLLVSWTDGWHRFDSIRNGSVVLASVLCIPFGIFFPKHFITENWHYILFFGFTFIILYALFLFGFNMMYKLAPKIIKK